MANKNTLKVRARRLRQAHERKVKALAMLELAGSQNRDSMISVVGNVDLLDLNSGDWINLPILHFEGTVTCVCEVHVFCPEGNDFTFNGDLDPRCLVDPFDYKSVRNKFQDAENYCVGYLTDVLDEIKEILA